VQLRQIGPTVPATILATRICRRSLGIAAELDWCCEGAQQRHPSRGTAGLVGLAGVALAIEDHRLALRQSSRRSELYGDLAILAAYFAVMESTFDWDAPRMRPTGRSTAFLLLMRNMPF
jgi:hypothetical protein